MTWRVARSLDVLLAQLNTRAPNRSKAADGSVGDLVKGFDGQGGQGKKTLARSAC